MFTVVLFIKAKKQKPKCPSNDVKLNKMWHVLIMEYYSAIKNKAALNHKGELERNQTQKCTYYMTPFI